MMPCVNLAYRPGGFFTALRIRHFEGCLQTPDGVGSHEDRERAGCDRRFHVETVKGKVGSRQTQFDSAGLSRLQRNPEEPLELAHRSSPATRLVPHIQLHDFRLAARDLAFYGLD